jgi:pimeloyl-ACP methyl ester carboxylesterase
MAYRVVVATALAAALVLGGCERKAAPPAAAITDTVASADGVAIKYEASGQGEPALVFVHCWTCNRGYWDEQAQHFGTRYRVVRLDLAGHGESGRSREQYTVEAFGADVAAVVNKLDLKQVVLIGHSMGGPVTVEAEKLLPGRVIGVVGVDTFHTGFVAPSGAKADEMMKPFEQDFAGTATKFMSGFFGPGADKALVERIARNAGAADPAMATTAMRNLLAWYQRSAPAALERLGTRLRNINGDPKSQGKALHASVTLVAGAGHFIPQEKPAEFDRALGQIVSELVAAARPGAAAAK